jgi:hypothetical protein
MSTAGRGYRDISAIPSINRTPMSDRNGDGLPLLAAVKANRMSKLESQRLTAEFALSRRRKTERPADEHEPDTVEMQDESTTDDVPPDQPPDEHEQEGES